MPNATLPTLTLAEWKAEGTKRFGEAGRHWRFICPSCGYVATAAEWIDAGAPETAIAYSCVGRYLPSAKDIFAKVGPCNYTGGGLFKLNPQEMIDDEGRSHHLFAFADVEGQDNAA